MSLTESQIKAREGRLTASRVGALMNGDATKIMALWREMVGDPSFVPEDLSGVWPVQLGTMTEALNLSWYARKTGRLLSRQGEVVVCPAADWACATLDAWDAGEPGPIDAKHVGGFEPRETIVSRYTPQMMWQMICTGARWSALSIIEGAREPVVEAVLWDEAYAAELWARAEAFMACVRDLIEPVALAPVGAPVRPEKTYDFTGNNQWADHAATWLANRDAAKQFDGAVKGLKDILPADAIKAHGHGIAASRSRSGAVSIKKEQA